MSDELKNGDRVRLRFDESVTGTFVGLCHGEAVVWLDGNLDFAVLAPDLLERIPDEVTITIPREVRDAWADRDREGDVNWGAIVLACKASKAAES